MRRKRVIFSLSLILIIGALTLVIGEAFVRAFSPVSSMYPRYQFSSEYGLQLYENTRMVHTLPGKYRFVYTTNAYAYRGKAVPPAPYPDKQVILVIGDSYSFGIGVADGAEYPTKLAEELGREYAVINLANPAWGLTQEIRRYYEFGVRYQPTIIVLQFCGNDPDDNFNNMVTTVQGDGFLFHPSNSNINWTKKFLSQSFIQKSQLYNYFRDKLYYLYEHWHVQRTKTSYAMEGTTQASASPAERFYADLLTAFASDLKKSDVQLVMISVNHELAGFPYIKERIQQLESEGKLRYVEIIPWFEHVSQYASPEGHAWGEMAHEIIGKNLAVYLRTLN